MNSHTSGMGGTPKTTTAYEPKHRSHRTVDSCRIFRKESTACMECVAQPYVGKHRAEVTP